MGDKLKLAVNWAAACGGCDVSLLDSEATLLDLTEAADVVYWPVAMDYKRADLEAWGPGEIDVGIFNGAIRTSEHEADARVMRERCKVLVAYGSCAAIGGIPGLGNLCSPTSILDVVYRDTASTDNPDDTRPQTRTPRDGGALELPAFQPTVRALHHVVDVDITVPGCPPPLPRVLDAVEVILGMAAGAPAPPIGTVLASDKALCDECPRIDTRTGRRVPHQHRPHEMVADPERCFLEQGLVCLGLATRGGCGATCIEANMPCRGCFGPTPTLLDPGAEALSAVASLSGLDHEDEFPTHKRLAPMRSIVDVAGTFYRFTLPSATLFRSLFDAPEK
ncbi:MAG: oxidoreductase [Deltaproteobacteria bacterium]|nr:oxidoreductase [Deltaproteobacteria bacterium]